MNSPPLYWRRRQLRPSLPGMWEPAGGPYHLPDAPGAADLPAFLGAVAALLGRSYTARDLRQDAAALGHHTTPAQLRAPRWPPDLRPTLAAILAAAHRHRRPSSPPAPTLADLFRLS